VQSDLETAKHLIRVISFHGISGMNQATRRLETASGPCRIYIYIACVSLNTKVYIHNICTVYIYMYNINIYHELYMKHNQHLLNSSRFMLSTCEKKHVVPRASMKLSRLHGVFESPASGYLVGDKCEKSNPKKTNEWTKIDLVIVASTDSYPY
jgi:hypothetical protein